MVAPPNKSPGRVPAGEAVQHHTDFLVADADAKETAEQRSHRRQHHPAITARPWQVHRAAWMMLRHFRPKHIAVRKDPYPRASGDP